MAKPMTLADRAGKTVLLNLWATWCAPCRAEMPALDALQKEKGGDKFEVIAVNVDTGDDTKPKKFLSETGIQSLGSLSRQHAGLFETLKKAGSGAGPAGDAADRRPRLPACQHERPGRVVQRRREAAGRRRARRLSLLGLYTTESKFGHEGLSGEGPHPRDSSRDFHSAHSETGRRVTGRRCAVVAFWALLVVFLSALWALNIRPQADADDILKLAQLRHVLETGVLTDRVVPQVLQPEVMVSHWTWIADAPYLLITLVMTPLLGRNCALAVAVFIVPPILLLVALALLFRIVVELGFDDSTMAFLLVAAFTTFVEFQPGRIDYHNIQMVLLLATLLLSMQAGRLPALANGAVTALSFSISPELAIFAALTMAIYACRFCWGVTGARQEIAAYGGSLAASALALFLLVVPPSAYFAPVCDQFALGHLVALVGAGVSFVAVASLPAAHVPLDSRCLDRRRRRWRPEG